jgi:hypothetical protein
MTSDREEIFTAQEIFVAQHGDRATRWLDALDRAELWHPSNHRTVAALMTVADEEHAQLCAEIEQLRVGRNQGERP